MALQCMYVDTYDFTSNYASMYLCMYVYQFGSFHGSGRKNFLVMS